MSTLAGLIKKSDVQLFRFFNSRLHSSKLNGMMKKITCMGEGYFVVAIPLLLILFGRSTIRQMGWGMAANLALSEGIVHTVKRAVNRPRPLYTLENIHLVALPPCQYSFPSGHTCGAFSLALSLGPLPAFIRMIALGLATLVGISRIYLGVHYPTDVAVGFLIALGTTLILF